MEDAIREIHGVVARERTIGGDQQSVRIREFGDDLIAIDPMHHTGALLTQWQARYLAAKLYRLARRIRDRETRA